MIRHLLAALLATCCFAANCPANDVTPLADCTRQVFREIKKNGSWSGQAPSQCNARIIVEKRPTGLFVTAWTNNMRGSGWERLVFSTAMAYEELTTVRRIKRAEKDIRARAIRLDRCLESIIKNNLPGECRDRATKSYQAGESSGIENRRLIWLDDDGRHAVVEHAYGNTSPTTAPPADLFSGERVLPGMIINLHTR